MLNQKGNALLISLLVIGAAVLIGYGALVSLVSQNRQLASNNDASFAEAVLALIKAQSEIEFNKQFCSAKGKNPNLTLRQFFELPEIKGKLENSKFLALGVPKKEALRLQATNPATGPLSDPLVKAYLLKNANNEDIVGFKTFTDICRRKIFPCSAEKTMKANPYFAFANSVKEITSCGDGGGKVPLDPTPCNLEPLERVAAFTGYSIQTPVSGEIITQSELKVSGVCKTPGETIEISALTLSGGPTPRGQAICDLKRQYSVMLSLPEINGSIKLGIYELRLGVFHPKHVWTPDVLIYRKNIGDNSRAHYLIKNTSDFLKIYEDPSGIYTLENDIDVSSFPIGRDISLQAILMGGHYGWVGELDGKGHTISGVKRPLFQFFGGSIHNVRISGIMPYDDLSAYGLVCIESRYGKFEDIEIFDSKIPTSGSGGGLCGKMFASTVNKVKIRNTLLTRTVNGSITGTDSLSTIQNINVDIATQNSGFPFVGSIVGVTRYSCIKNVYSSATVTALPGRNGGYYGGIVGLFDSSELLNAKSDGIVDGSGCEDQRCQFGGVIGFSYLSIVKQTSSLATIKATGGGVVGDFTRSIMDRVSFGGEVQSPNPLISKFTPNPVIGLLSGNLCFTPPRDDQNPMERLIPITKITNTNLNNPALQLLLDQSVANPKNCN